MRIAVSGASGFVGRPLVAALAASGHEVLALGRNPDAMRAFLPSAAVAQRFDATQPPPQELMRGCDAVVNLLGEPIGQRWTPEVKRRIRESRVQGTRALAEAAAASGTVKTFVSASAVGYYGDRGDTELDESAGPGSDFLARVCVDWEAAAEPARAAGIRVVHLRIGQLLGEHSVLLRKLLPVFRLGLGGPLGSGAQVMSWLHLDDLLGLIKFVLEHPELEGPVNATAPNPVTNRELARTLGKVLRRPAAIPTPAFAVRLAMGEMAEAALTGQRVLPRRAMRAGFQFRYPELEGALLASLPRS